MQPCDFCGAPGWPRHGPDGPYSAVFCDRCYRRRAVRMWLICVAAIAAFILIKFAF